MQPFLHQPWWDELSSWQQEALELSHQLYQRELNTQTRFPDYSFIVFPAAKAYEGFLKDLLFKLHLIDKPTYESRRFRIGRALNPDIHNGRRDEQWLYDDVTRQFGKDIARQLWETWLECRNHIFHYFPHQENQLTLIQAKHRLDIILAAIEATHLHAR